MKYLLPSTITQIEAFFDDYPIRKFKKGQVLVLPGEVAEHAYLLIEGRLRLYDMSYKGDPIIVDIFKSPSFFPLSLIMNHSPSFLVHEADTDIVVRQAPVDATLEFLNTNPPVVLNLLSVLYKKFDDALIRMIRLMDSSAKVRLINEIIVACNQIGEQNPDGSYKIQIDQAALGGRMGLARETVGREIKSLKERNLIQVGRAYITVPDVSKLDEYLKTHK
jgi:CRP-like cAMP-binding protein